MVLPPSMPILVVMPCQNGGKPIRAFDVLVIPHSSRHEYVVAVCPIRVQKSARSEIHVFHQNFSASIFRVGSASLQARGKGQRVMEG